MGIRTIIFSNWNCSLSDKRENHTWPTGGCFLSNWRGVEHAPLGHFRKFSESQGRVKSEGRVTVGGTWLLSVGNHTLKVAVFFKNYRLWIENSLSVSFQKPINKIKMSRKVTDMKIKAPKYNRLSIQPIVKKKGKSITDTRCSYTSLSAMCTNQLSKSRDPSRIFICRCHNLWTRTHTQT